MTHPTIKLIITLINHYAVIGNPIDHSLSPTVHCLFATQTCQSLDYQKILVPLDKLSEMIDHLQRENYHGLSITAPFKQDAFYLTTQITERARLARSINTLVFQPDGHRLGDNTDGIGLVHDLTINHHIKLCNQSLLIFGAGGAVRNIVLPLLDANPLQIMIANRTKEKAAALCRDFHSPKLLSCSLETLPLLAFDIIINATGANLCSNVSITPALFHNNTVFYDLSYGRHTQPLQQWVSTLGITRYYDGLGMLVEQAAEQFFLWRKVRPNTRAAIALLRNMHPS